MQTLKQQYKQVLKELKSKIKRNDNPYFICHLPSMRNTDELYNHFQNQLNNLETLHPEIYKETRDKFINLYGKKDKYISYTPFLSNETELRIRLLTDIVNSL